MYFRRPHFERSLDYDNNSCVDNTRGNIRTLSETRAKTRNVIDKKHYVRLAMRGLQGTFTLRAQNADCRPPGGTKYKHESRTNALPPLASARDLLRCFYDVLAKERLLAVNKIT